MFLFPRSTFLHLQVVFKNKIVLKKTGRMPPEIFFSVCCPILNVSVLSLLLKLKTHCSFPSPVLISPVESTHHFFLTLHVPLIPLSLPSSSSGSPCSTTGHACQKTRQVALRHYSISVAIAPVPQSHPHCRRTAPITVFRALLLPPAVDLSDLSLSTFLPSHNTLFRTLPLPPTSTAD